MSSRKHSNTHPSTTSADKNWQTGILYYAPFVKTFNSYANGPIEVGSVKFLSVAKRTRDDSVPDPHTLTLTVRDLNTGIDSNAHANSISSKSPVPSGLSHSKNGHVGSDNV